MNLPTWYDAGTVSVAGGSATVTGTGTLWGGDAIMVGDLFCDLAQPLVPPQRVASVTDDGVLELASPWPGADLADAAYEIRYVGIIERSTAQSRKVLEQLGDVKAWADVFVVDDAARLALETASNPLRAGFRVLVINDGLIWMKATGAYDDWLPPAAFKGDTGNKGWSPVFGIATDGARRVWQLAAWVGGAGAAPAGVGKYVGAAGLVDNIGDGENIRGPAGNITGLTPFWQLRVTEDAVGLADQATAEAGLDDELLMTPLTTAKAILALSPPSGPELLPLVPEDGPRGGPMSLLNARDVFLGDDALCVVNQQELAAWYKALRDASMTFASAGTVAANYIFMVGDSKVATPVETHTYLKEFAEWNDLGQVQTKGFAYSGQNTYQLKNAAVAALKADAAWSSCRCVIIDFGTNEQVAGATGGAQSLAQTEANLRDTIDALRNTGSGGRSADDMSIVILGQTPANSVVNGQIETLMRELDTIYRRVAKAKNVVFIDQRGRFPRPHDDADWMDNLGPTYGNAQVHPQHTFQALRMGVVCDVLFPPIALNNWWVPVFQSLILDSGWTTWAAGYDVRAYKQKGWVKWEGMLRTSTTNAANTPVAHLPVLPGWAPSVNRFYITNASNEAFGTFYIRWFDGAVIIQKAWTTPLQWLSLDAVNYRVRGAQSG